MKLTLTLFLGGALLLLPASARAEVVRYRFSSAAAGYTTLKANPNGAAGEWQPWIGALRRESWYCPVQATHMVTFRHPYTNCNVTVPMRFPGGPSRMTTRSNGIFYTFDSYTIDVQFLADGSVETVYNSGVARPLW